MMFCLQMQIQTLKIHYPVVHLSSSYSLSKSLISKRFGYAKGRTWVFCVYAFSFIKNHEKDPNRFFEMFFR